MATPEEGAMPAAEPHAPRPLAVELANDVTAFAAAVKEVCQARGGVYASFVARLEALEILYADGHHARALRELGPLLAELVSL